MTSRTIIPHRPLTAALSRLDALVVWLTAACEFVVALPARGRRTLRAYAHRPQHALRGRTQAVRYPVGEHAEARHYRPLTGAELIACRVVYGALVAVTVLIAWYGFDLGGLA